jgi:hypothetical protein
VVAGGIERGFGDADGGGSTGSPSIRLLSGLQRVEQALAQSEILR